MLVGDDRQLAAIDAGGGFRALRLRLGASELTENRRQQQAWEREALELVRSGLGRRRWRPIGPMIGCGGRRLKPAATLALLQDWWAMAGGRAGPGPGGDRVGRPPGRGGPAEHRLPGAPGARGRLGAEELQVEDRQLAIGDRVVCGHNAIAELGVANGSRGVVAASTLERAA